MPYRKRLWSEFKAADMLEMLGRFRKAIIEHWQNVPFEAPLYKQERKLLDAIDESAEILTGDKTHFHVKPHGTPGLEATVNSPSKLLDDAAIEIAVDEVIAECDGDTRAYPVETESNA